MDLGLGGKVALVTAASKGLGRAVATELAREDGHVVLSSRDEGTLAAPTFGPFLRFRGKRSAEKLTVAPSSGAGRLRRASSSVISWGGLQCSTEPLLVTVTSRTPISKTSSS